jgi:protein ImuA
MQPSKADIIARLQKEILPLQGYKKAAVDGVNINLGPINQSFPNHSFPVAAIHEFIAASAEDAAATTGFVTGILSFLMQLQGAAIWINHSQTVFPPALKGFGIAPEKIIFIHLKKEKEMLWAMEEALQCEGLAAVIAEIPELNFNNSRRLQLAVEKSRVTGFIIRQQPKIISTTASITRWKITPLPTKFLNGMPGLAFPRWNIELLKVRNGKPGNWQMQFVGGQFKPVETLSVLVSTAKMKAV